MKTNNPFSAYDLMSATEKSSFNARIATLSPYEPNLSTGFFDRTLEQVKAYNSLSLFSAEGPINNFYEDPEYSPNRDSLVQNNAWISKQYPAVWSSLMASKSRLYSASVIENVNKNHHSAAKIGEGSFGGILMGGLMAGVVDPVNFLFPVLGAMTKSGAVTTALSASIKANQAKKVASLTLRERATYNAIENATVAALVEPLFQEADITRTELDGLMEIGLAGGFGAGFGAAFHAIGSTYRAASTSASRRLTGYDTPQEAAEAFGSDIWKASIDTPEKKAYWDRYSKVDALTEITREEVDRGVQYIDDAIGQIVPGLGKVQGINKLLKWAFLNPVQQMYGSSSQKVSRLAYELIESVFQIDDNPGRAPVDSKIKLVDHIFGQKVREHGDLMDQFVADNLDLNISSDEIADLVSHLARTGKNKVSDVDPMYMVNLIEENQIVKKDPFASIRGNKKIEAIVEKSVEEYRNIIKILDGTANETGFLSSILRDYDINGMNLATYVARWIDPNKVDLRLVSDSSGNKQVDLFVDSIVEGIENTKAKTLAVLKSDHISLINERRNILNRLNQFDVTEIVKPDRGRNYNIEYNRKSRDILRSKLEKLEERIKAVEEAMDEKKSWSEVELRRLAMSIAHNYTASYDDSAAKTKGGIGGAKEILRRKVDIEDRFITPWLVNDTRATLEKAQVHLVPKMILADEIMNRFTGNLNFNQMLNSKLKELKELDERITGQQDVSGVYPKEEDAIKLNGLKDEVADLVRESQLIKQMLMITTDPTDVAFLKNPMDQNRNFNNVEQAIDFVHRLSSSRMKTRDQLSSVLHSIKNTEEEILTATKDLEVQPLIKERIIRERDLDEVSNQEIPEEPFLSVLVEKFAPRLKGKTDFLDPSNEVTNFNVEYIVDNRLALSARLVGEKGLPKKVRVLEVEGAISKDRSKSPISFSFEEKPGFVAMSKDGKWAWIPPEQVADLKKRAFEKKLGDLPSGDPKVMKLKKKLRIAKEEGKEFGKSKFKTLQERYETDRKNEIARLELRLEKVNERINEVLNSVEGFSQKSLLELDAKHKNLWSKFHILNKTFIDQTETLDDIALQTSRINRTKKHISQVAKSEEVDSGELSIFDGIGFEVNHSYYERFGWNPASVLRLTEGAEDLDLRSGYSTFQGEVYHSSLIAQEERRQNTQFFLDPEFLVADVIRERALTSEEIGKARENLQFIFSQLQNKSISPDTDVNWQKFSRIVKNLNYMRYMGMVTIASLGDFGNAVGTLGFGRYVRTLFTMFDNWKDREQLSALASVVAAGEIAGPMSRNTQLLGVDAANTFIDPTTGAPRSTVKSNNSKITNVIESVDSATNQNSAVMNLYNKYGNFLSQWNGFNKRIVTLGVEDMVLDLAIKKAAGETLDARDMGILNGLRFTEKDLDQIYGNWSAIDSQDSQRTRKKKMLGREFYISNSGYWQGAFAYEYEMKIRSAVNTVIVTPTIGDLPKFFQDPKFSPFVQFKSFLMSSTNKMFLPMVQRGIVNKDPNQLAMIFGTSMLGTLSYAIYETMAGNDIFKDSEYTDEKTNETKTRSWVNKAVLEGIDRGGSFALLFSLSNVVDRHAGLGIHSIFGGELNRKYRARTLGDTVLGPAGGLINDLQKSLTGIADIVTQRGVSESQLTSMRRLLPWQNSIWVRLLADSSPSVVKALSESDGTFVSKDFSEKYFDNYATLQANLLKVSGAE